MSSAVVTVHLPNGEREFRSAENPPKPGELMMCRGTEWIVAHVIDAPDGSVVVSLIPAQASPVAAAA